MREATDDEWVETLVASLSDPALVRRVLALLYQRGVLGPESLLMATAWAEIPDAEDRGAEGPVWGRADLIRGSWISEAWFEGGSYHVWVQLPHLEDYERDGFATRELAQAHGDEQLLVEGWHLL